MKALKRIGPNGWRYVFFIPLILFLVLQVFSFCSSNEERLVNQLDDDAYYYFKIARNFVEEGRLTFDGRTETDGFQPLWMLVLLPLFFLVKDPLLVLRWVGVLSTLLAGISGWLGFLSLRRFSPIPFTFGALILLISLYSIGITGMETALVIPLAIAALLIHRRLDAGLAGKPARHSFILLGLCLGLLFWARLDSIWLILSILAVFSLRALSLRNTAWLWTASIFGAFFLLYFAFEWVLFGRLMPVSGMAKSLSGSPLIFNSLFLDQLLHGQDPASGNLWPAFGIIFLFAVVFCLLWGLTFLARRPILPPEDRYVPLCVSLGFVLFTAYALFRSTWVLWRWYAYPLVTMGLFVFPVVLEAIQRRLEAGQGARRILRALAWAFFLLGFTQLTIQAVQTGLWSRYSAPAFRYDNYQLARQLNARLPESARIAMGDRAGSFGYFFHGSVLQLEGLVADADLLKAIRQDRLDAYLSARGVEYVLTYWEPPSPDAVRWTLLTPLPGFSVGPQAGIDLCRENEVFRFSTPYETFSLWKWPACP